MARQLDQILVIDLESTCWQGEPPEGQKNEIIQVGLCPVDLTTLERIGKVSILVKPTQSEVSEFCTELTGLTTEEVESGGKLSDATRI